VVRAKTFRRSARDYSFSIAFWLSFSLLVAWQASVDAREEHLRITLHTLLILHGVRFFTVGILTPPLFYIIESFPVRAAHTWRRVLLYIAGYPVFTTVFACIRWSLHPPWMPETMSWGPRTAMSLFQLTYGMFADELVIYLAIVLAGHAYFYFVLSQQQEREQMLMQQALTQSELQALKRQMQPHFLFNTLHGIMTLVGSDPRRAQQMLLNLSGLLRRSLRQADSDLVTLGEDMKFAEDYLAIEKMRLDERLVVEWEIAADTRNLLVPQLVLQPLLENAIKHGIAPCRGGGWVHVASKRSSHRLTLEIRNSTCGNVVKGNGVGHQNIQARLQFLFGQDAEMIFHCEGNVAEARVSLPALLALHHVKPGAVDEEEKTHATLNS
jgi:two-component system LytT family sensor kinase